MKTIKLLISTSTLALFAACASAPPPVLLEARAAYQRAAGGPAERLTPAELHVAKQALDLAELTFKDEGGNDFKTVDRAYIAMRKAELAEAKAGLVEADKQAESAREIATRQLAEDASRTRSALTDANQQLAGTKEKLAGTQQALAGTKEQLMGTKEALAAEQIKREEAEKRAQQAANDLAKFAMVKQEPRGMVITLSGGVLFVSGKSELLPTAQAKLAQVAEALTKEDPDSRIVVEGHTDSQGSADLNQSLSTARAESVRSFLITRGVAADRISAVGLAFSRPIADNKSAEGRANNRRVEIIVQPQPTS